MIYLNNLKNIKITSIGIYLALFLSHKIKKYQEEEQNGRLHSNFTHHMGGTFEVLTWNMSLSLQFLRSLLSN